MGHFLAISAIRDSNIDDVAEAVVQFALQHNVDCELIDAPADDEKPSRDTSIFAPSNGWITILWPEYFNSHDFATCQRLSQQLKTVVCTVHVYDDDYWAHALFDSGEWIDRFCSVPDYFAENDADAQRLADEYKGNPSAFAERFSLVPDSIAGYFVQFPARQPRKSILSMFKRSHHQTPTGKVVADDEFEIENFWVFTDFWKRLGIVYPDDMTKWKKRIRLHRKFNERFPELGEL